MKRRERRCRHASALQRVLFLDLSGWRSEFFITLPSSGIVREADEGTTVHLFQILMVGHAPVMAFFAMTWLPRNPGHALRLQALQVGAALIAAASVFFFTCRRLLYSKTYCTVHPGQRRQTCRAILGEGVIAKTSAMEDIFETEIIVSHSSRKRLEWAPELSCTAILEAF
jgi:hypothetical protein